MIPKKTVSAGMTKLSHIDRLWFVENRFHAAAFGLAVDVQTAPELG